MTIDSVPSPQIPVQSANSLAARREARRRKILENAENRLKKLTGVEQKSHVLIDDYRPIEYEDTNTENQIEHNRLAKENLSNIGMNHISPSSSSQSPLNENPLNGVGKLKYTKLGNLVGISFLANLFTILSKIFCDETESNIGLNMIFLPFLGFKCLEYFLQKDVIPETNIFQLLLVANLRNDVFKQIFVYTQYLTSFTQDLCIYFFIFVCVNQLFKLSLILR